MLTVETSESLVDHTRASFSSICPAVVGNETLSVGVVGMYILFWGLLLRYGQEASLRFHLRGVQALFLLAMDQRQESEYVDYAQQQPHYSPFPELSTLRPSRTRKLSFLLMITGLDMGQSWR